MADPPVPSGPSLPGAAGPNGLPAAGRRIEPSPPAGRSRLVTGILIALLAGLPLFGSGGWFAGRATAPEQATESAAAPSQPARAAPAPSLGVFEQRQVAANRQFFADSALGTIVEGWLPHLSTCSRSGRAGGPALKQGEKVRVRCTLDGMSAIFVEYRSIADRDRAREQRLADSEPDRTPGIGRATGRPAPSGRTSGNYAEYAYRLTQKGTTRTVSGIWWDDAKTPIAGYLLAFWKDGLGERWEPMRDLWSRYA